MMFRTFCLWPPSMESRLLYLMSVRKEFFLPAFSFCLSKSLTDLLYSSSMSPEALPWITKVEIFFLKIVVVQCSPCRSDCRLPSSLSTCRTWTSRSGSCGWSPSGPPCGGPAPGSSRPGSRSDPVVESVGCSFIVFFSGIKFSDRLWTCILHVGWTIVTRQDSVNSLSSLCSPVRTIESVKLR